MFSNHLRRLLPTFRCSQFSLFEVTHQLKSVEKSVTKYSFLSVVKINICRNYATGTNNSPKAVPQLKRTIKKKKVALDGLDGRKGLWDVAAYSTAEEYDLEKLVSGLIKEDLYKPTNFGKELGSTVDVLHAVAKYELEKEPREIFLFREGTAVLWNVPELERDNVLNFLKPYEHGSYSQKLVQDEMELVTYIHSPVSGTPTKISDDTIILSSEGDLRLDKYTISNSMSLSVKLATWEASLIRYIDSMELVTEDLKTGRKIKMSREQVLMKTGELFALRHVINLSSDLLDTPDFYWDREDLEQLYQQACSYYCITRRTKVMNEKLNHCIELVELLSSHLNDCHHVRLEWMIIALITVEVLFEIGHYVERFVEKDEVDARINVQT